MVLQTSNDSRITPEDPDAGTWFTEPTTISGCDAGVADGSIVQHFDSINTAYARLQLTVTTAGTISVYGTSKE